MIDVRDVAAAICGALDAECYGEPLQMSGHDISTEELYSLICELGGVRCPSISTATTVAIASAYTMELMLGMVGEKTPLPAGGMMMATLFDYIVSGNELQKLGITRGLLVKPWSMLSNGIVRLAIAEAASPNLPAHCFFFCSVR